MNASKFTDRSEAGRALAAQLQRYAGRDDVLVLALPRGGVPVAYEVARALGAPLDVFLVRKLGVPGHEELAMGAVATGGVRVLNDQVVRALGIPPDVIDMVAAWRQQQPARRVVAVPTAAAQTCDALRTEADDVVCATTPEPFDAVGFWYEDFSQTTDDEVRELLDRAARADRAA